MPARRSAMPVRRSEVSATTGIDNAMPTITGPIHAASAGETA